MKFSKKLATIGMIGTLVIGQSVSALAATTYGVKTPVVTVSNTTSEYTYYVETSVTASSASYLRATQYMEYNIRGSSSTSYTEKKTSDSIVRETDYNPMRTFSGNMGDHIGYLKAYCKGYYFTSKNGTAHYIATKSTTKIPAPAIG